MTSEGTEYRIQRGSWPAPRTGREAFSITVYPSRVTGKVRDGEFNHHENGFTPSLRNPDINASLESILAEWPRIMWSQQTVQDKVGCAKLQTCEDLQACVKYCKRDSGCTGSYIAVEIHVIIPISTRLA